MLALAAFMLATAFDVTSVKPSTSGKMAFAIDPVLDNVGRFSARSATLKDLVRIAYGKDEAWILGGPAWLSTERFDIDAKVDGHPSRVEIMAMLRSLLVDRFQLKAHLDSKEMSQSALVIAKSGPKYGPNFAKVEGRECPTDAVAKEGCRGFHFVLTGFTAENTPISTLARVMADVARRVVTDETGLQGNYDVKLDWAVDNRDVPPGGNWRDVAAVSMIAAFQQQLGLTLESRKGKVEILVIDNAQRPSAN